MVASAIVAVVLLVALSGFILRYRRELLSTFLATLTAAASLTVAVTVIVRDLSASAILLLGFSLLAALGALRTLWRSAPTPPS
jgi:hypothetical protein